MKLIFDTKAFPSLVNDMIVACNQTGVEFLTHDHFRESENWSECPTTYIGDLRNAAGIRFLPPGTRGYV